MHTKAPEVFHTSGAVSYRRRLLRSFKKSLCYIVFLPDFDGKCHTQS